MSDPTTTPTPTNERQDVRGTAFGVTPRRPYPEHLYPGCPCAACDRRSVMNLCPTCGNKRCPAASDHARWACTGSNSPGQARTPIAPTPPTVSERRALFEQAAREYADATATFVSRPDDRETLARHLYEDHIERPGAWDGCQDYIRDAWLRTADAVLASSWLAERDRQVAEQAWDAGRDVGHREAEMRHRGDTSNPYRAGSATPARPTTDDREAHEAWRERLIQTVREALIDVWNPQDDEGHDHASDVSRVAVAAILAYHPEVCAALAAHPAPTVNVAMADAAIEALGMNAYMTPERMTAHHAALGVVWTDPRTVAYAPAWLRGEGR